MATINKELESEMAKPRPLVSCLCATRGRFRFLRKALWCFLQQDYPNKELVILNNHPEPLTLAEDYPGVHIHNETGFKHLGEVRQRCFELADPGAKFVRSWDDDDLYLPWAIRQGVERIGQADAYRPSPYWHMDGYQTVIAARNAAEPSMTFRKSAVARMGYGGGEGDEHAPIMAMVERNGAMADEEVGWRASYVCCWGTGAWKFSGSFGNGQTVDERLAAFYEHSDDTGRGEPLSPLGCLEHWRTLVLATAMLLPIPEHEKLSQILLNKVTK